MYMRFSTADGNDLPQGVKQKLKSISSKSNPQKADSTAKKTAKKAPAVDESKHRELEKIKKEKFQGEISEHVQLEYLQRIQKFDFSQKEGLSTEDFYASEATLEMRGAIGKQQVETIEKQLQDLAV